MERLADFIRGEWKPPEEARHLQAQIEQAREDTERAKAAKAHADLMRRRWSRDHQ